MCHCFITIIKQHTWPLTKRKLPFPRNRRQTESDRNHFFFSFFSYNSVTHQREKKGTHALWTTAGDSKKKGNWKWAKMSQYETIYAKGGARKKSKWPWRLFLAYGKILTIAGNPLLKYYLMSEFQNRFWQSPVPKNILAAPVKISNQSSVCIKQNKPCATLNNFKRKALQLCNHCTARVAHQQFGKMIT